MASKCQLADFFHKKTVAKRASIIPSQWQRRYFVLKVRGARLRPKARRQLGRSSQRPPGQRLGLTAGLHIRRVR